MEKPGTGSLSYSVSHDLRAPLRSIDGFSQALLEDHGETLDSSGRDYLRRVRAAAQRMGQLIDDLLQLSQVGRTPLRRERVDLSGLAREVVEALHRTTPDREIRALVADGLVADADAGLLRALLENLFVNAWKFTATRAQPRVEFLAERQNGRIVYAVRDMASGSTWPMRASCSRRFSASTPPKSSPATGIGLATVRRIVDRHGGRVWAEGSVGNGATVFWTLSNHCAEA